MQLNEMSREQLLAHIAALQASKQRPVTLKVSEKGAVAIYGLGRFPVTLYKSQWDKVIALVKSGELEAFIKANERLLSVKD